MSTEQLDQERLDAAQGLADVFAHSGNLLGPTLGPHLTCTETEAVADFMRAFGLSSLADSLIEGHADSDEVGDLHFEEVEMSL